MKLIHNTAEPTRMKTDDGKITSFTLVMIKAILYERTVAVTCTMTSSLSLPAAAAAAAVTLCYAVVTYFSLRRCPD